MSEDPYAGLGGGFPGSGRGESIVVRKRRASSEVGFGGLIPPAGFIFLVDSDGAFLVDSDGAFYVEAL